MPKEYQKPSCKTDGEREVYEHPAYGLVSLSIITGGGTLFGSDINHQHRVRLTIKRARHERSLSNDWYFSHRQSLIDVELSHAQFAELITTSNRGEGTPCTIQNIDGNMLPGIEPVENRTDMLRREVEVTARRRMRATQDVTKRLGELIESGKMSKTELRALHKELTNNVERLPGDVGFIVEMGQEAMEKLVGHAKVEIEATIANHVRKLGLEAAQKAGIIGPDYQLPE
jgi:hypothetical protein